MKHHPYGDDAPYMQAYDRILLDNDRYTDILLQKLNPTGTPTFRIPSRPPSHVLDLGCGSGHWVIEAATAWCAAGTKVIGLDLVDVFTEQWKAVKASMPNVEFVRGNFLHYKLPFPNNKFDLVRMANLSLCIPYDKWEFVLGEVRRVLIPNGRLELIDDQLFFPYGKPPSEHSPTPSGSSGTTSRSLPKMSSFDSDSEDDSDGDDVDVTLPFKSFSRPRGGFPDPGLEREKLTTRSKNLESVFEKMLEKKYRIHPRPYEFVRQILQRVFGKHNVTKTASKHLLLSPPENSTPERNRDSDGASHRSVDSGFVSGSSSSSTSLLQSKKSWITLDYNKDKKGEKSKSWDSSPWDEACLDVNRRKAGYILGLDRRRNDRYQSPGLILWPSTPIAIPPMELEMHVCKYIHVLLGCKPALGEYISEFKDEKGRPYVSEKEFQDFIWDYECFRRHRFNWPSDIPEVEMKEPIKPLSRKPSVLTRNRPVNSGHTRDTSSSLHNKPSKLGPGPGIATDKSKYNYDDLTHVRTIRIFEAFKVDNVDN